MTVRSIAMPALVSGLLLLGAPATAEAQESVQTLTAACERGSAWQCYELGVRYDVGAGVERDPAGAVAPYRRGCDGAVASACFNLALLYYQGRGVPADLPRAAALLQRACDGWLAIGCTNLGVFYQQGLGVAADQTRAAELSRRACELDNAECAAQRAPGGNAVSGRWSALDESDQFLFQLAVRGNPGALESSLKELSQLRLPALVRGVTLQASLTPDD